MPRPRHDQPHPVDTHVGETIRRRRKFLGYSQACLGRKLGLTFQQVQRYERGLNCVSASRLHDLAQALDVPVGYFFDGLPGTRERTSGESERHREAGQLVDAYQAIRDPLIRKAVFHVVLGIMNRR